jgi:hypothetical protein
MADFANGGKIDPRATFSRSDTPPTYAAPSAVHYWSNEKHLSSENLLLQSQDFDTTWAVSGIGSPTGSQTSSTEYTAVAHLKAGTASHGYLTIRTDAINQYAGALLDFSAGTISVTAAGMTSQSGTVTALGSGWFRVTVTATSSSSLGSPNVNIGVSDGTAIGLYGRVVWSPVGTETMYAWGAQLSTTGTKVYDSPTTTQVARSYASSLKSVSYAGQPRFEYSTDGESMGILVEGSSTNLLPYSSDASQLSGVKNDVDSNVAIAPDGTLSADKMRADYAAGLSGNSLRIGTWSVTSGQQYTISYYAKAAELNFIAINFRNLNSAFAGGSAYYNLNTGTVDSNSGLDSYGIESCGNGWYRCWATSTATATATATYYLWVAIDTAGTLVDRDGYSGVLIWGGQIEAGHMSSLISTSGSQVTRAADSLSMVDSNLFDNGGGTLYAEASRNAISTYNGIFSVDDGSSSNIVQMFGNSNNFRTEISSGGTTVANISAAGHTAGTFHKHCVSFSPTEAKYYVNGSQIGSTDTDLNIPTMSQIHLGVLNASGNHLNGHIKRVAVFSEPVSATNAAALTS